MALSGGHLRMELALPPWWLGSVISRGPRALPYLPAFLGLAPQQNQSAGRAGGHGKTGETLEMQDPEPTSTLKIITT